MSELERSNKELFRKLQELREKLIRFNVSARYQFPENQRTKTEPVEPEDLWKLALELSSEGVWDWDIGANRIYFSRQWKEALGYFESEIGETFEEWSERIHSADLQKTLIPLIDHLNGVTDSYTSEHRLRCKDGKYLWVLAKGKIVARNEVGDPLRMVGIHRDISYQRRTEFDLGERIKELNCHNRMAEIIGNSALTADEVINQIVQIIPDSWQFPELAQVSALIYDKVFETVGYKKSELTLRQEVKVQGEVIGKVEVGYPDGLILDAVTVFLPEESLLLFSIANRLGSYIEKSKKGIALYESQVKYRNIIENINDVIFEIDVQGVITFVSSSVGKILGFKAEEITGKDFKEFVGSNSQFLSQRLNELSEQGELKNEYQVVTKTGESRWIQISTHAKIADGSFIGATGSMVDITDRKHAEAELQKSEALYRSVLNASPDTISITTLEGVILYSSPRIMEMFGYSDPKDIIDRSLFDFLHKDEHELARSNIGKMFEGILPGASEYLGIRSDGSTFNIEVNADFIRDSEGNATNLLFVTRDISERKLAEERLRKSEEKHRNLIESLNDAIYEIAPDGSIIYVSPSIERIMGYTPGELIGRNCFEFIYPEDSQKVMEVLSGLGVSGVPHLDYRYITKSGSISWVRTSTSPIFENGQIIGGTGTLTDITERKTAEEKIEKLNRLYSVISHISQAIVHIRDKDQLMREVCSIAVEYGKFRMAWIGIIDDETKVVKPVVAAGNEDGYLSVIKQISVSDVPEGRGPTGTAIRNGDHFVCANIETDPGLGPWRKEALDRGYRSSMALPLKQSGRIVGAFSLYSSMINFFDKEEIQLLDEFVNEISFAFDTIDSENERIKAENELRKLSRAVDQSPVSIVISDLLGNIEYANPKASQTTGYSFAELIGQNPRVLKSGETPDSEYQKLWEDITSGKEWRGIFHNKRKNGELYWESSTISQIIDNQGNITHFLAVKEDITEKKFAEEELRQSEERYKVLFENDHTVMMIIDPQTGEIKNVNPAACNYYGWSSSEFCGKKNWEISGLDPDILKSRMQQAYNLQVNQFYSKHKLRNGEIRDVEVFSNPVQIGESKLVFTIVNDITERILAEQEILKFRTIADQANYGSAITSLDGDLIYINDAFAQMHGYQANELIGKKLSVFHNEEQLVKVGELLNQLHTHGSFSVQEVWHTRKNGTRFPTLMNASIIFDSQNIPQFLSSTAIDISELMQKELALQRSEAELNDAQKLANLGSWEHNLVTGRLVGSKNYYRMLGLEPDVKNVDLYDHFVRIVHPDDLKVIEFLQKHPYSENEMQVVELRIVLPDGDTRWIQNNVVPVFENDRLVALRGVNMDITEKKKILEDLIRAKEQAEESDKLKTTFLNNISHEIRTPFNGILGFLSMLQFDDLTSGERDEYIDFINQSAERLMNTINDIVDISQIQSGLMTITNSEIDIQRLIEEEVARFIPEAKTKGLEFNVRYELDKSIRNFETDGKKLSTILFHLQSNALKFTKSGSIDLSVRGNEQLLEFCIKDTGIGISPDKQQIIFSRFMQADHSNTRKFEGSGLGLTLAKAFVEMLNGKLWLESEEGKGSSFYFTIPNSHKPMTEHNTLVVGKLPDHPNDLKILIAEDDEGSAVFISILAKQFGKEILMVKSGVEAVEVCRNNPDIDLILMDIQMPVMDGYEATHQIREFNPEVVIIAQTAFALTGDSERALGAGCDDYISKPIQKDKLQQIIQKYFS